MPDKYKNLRKIYSKDWVNIIEEEGNSDAEFSNGNNKITKSFLIYIIKLKWFIEKLEQSLS